MLALQEGDLKSAMEQLQWGVSWLELFHRQKESLKDKADLKRLASAVTLLSRVLAEEGTNYRNYVSWEKPCDTCDNTVYMVYSVGYSPCYGYPFEDSNAYIMVKTLGSTYNTFYDHNLGGPEYMYAAQSK